ncbi:SH3 domain-containing protein [Frigidibacter sp. ROC022]|uniref:SH3 domain-containing protein n=1 Tax=Frigidibacter sp. ROC022 TaxID=2971796 RepID=UPI00215B26E4|nr:SH3 domain-containing protein [Frigidibacter sp. ROC022]MCR8726520.1 SH3 domain-containing protein [Frigidibacter sp. ROC022]
MVGGRDLSPEEMAELGIAAPEPAPAEAADPQEAPDVDVAQGGTAPVTPEPAQAAEPVVPEPAAVVAAVEPEVSEPPAVEAPDPVVAELPVESSDPPVDLPSVADEIQAALAESQVWYVTGNVVNVRSGPSTSYEVVGKVTYGEATEILSDPSDDWVKIRIQGDGVEGYMARRFLQDSEPNG